MNNNDYAYQPVYSKHVTELMRRMNRLECMVCGGDIVVILHDELFGTDITEEQGLDYLHYFIDQALEAYAMYNPYMQIGIIDPGVQILSQDSLGRAYVSGFTDPSIICQPTNNPQALHEAINNVEIGPRSGYHDTFSTMYHKTQCENAYAYARAIKLAADSVEWQSPLRPKTVSCVSFVFSLHFEIIPQYEQYIRTKIESSHDLLVEAHDLLGVSWPSTKINHAFWEVSPLNYIAHPPGWSPDVDFIALGNPWISEGLSELDISGKAYYSFGILYPELRFVYQNIIAAFFRRVLIADSTFFYKYPQSSVREFIGWDGGVNLPALNALAGTPLTPDPILNLRSAIEKLVASGFVTVSGQPFPFSYLFFFINNLRRSKYGATGNKSTWTRSKADMLGTPPYDLDIGEVYEAINLLESWAGIM